MTEPPPRLRHICEVCARDEILTAAEVVAAGWDPPPGGYERVRHGRSALLPHLRLEPDGVVGARQEPDAVLTAEQMATVDRIAAEPGSVTDGD